MLALSVRAHAQQPAFPIWPGDAPGSEKWTRQEGTFTGFGNQQMVRNVVRPADGADDGECHVRGCIQHVWLLDCGESKPRKIETGRVLGPEEPEGED